MKFLLMILICTGPKGPLISCDYHPYHGMSYRTLAYCETAKKFLTSKLPPGQPTDMQCVEETGI